MRAMMALAAAMMLWGCKDPDPIDTDDTDADTDADSDSDTDADTDSDTDTDTDTDTDSDTDSDTDADCISPASLGAIAAHVDDLGGSGALLLGHAGSREAVAAFLFPGYRGMSAQYATLFEECTAETLFDEWCDGDLCWQLACTGVGAGNKTYGRLASKPFTDGGFVFDDARMDTEWVEATNDVVFTLLSTSTSPEGVDLSLSGTAVMHADGTMSVSETYPGLVDGGAILTATLDIDATTTTGDLRAGDVLLAEYDGHDLVATGDCP